MGILEKVPETSQQHWQFRNIYEHVKTQCLMQLQVQLTSSEQKLKLQKVPLHCSSGTRTHTGTSEKSLFLQTLLSMEELQ